MLHNVGADISISRNSKRLFAEVPVERVNLVYALILDGIPRGYRRV
jgi:hypothetical protein